MVSRRNTARLQSCSHGSCIVVYLSPGHEVRTIGAHHALPDEPHPCRSVCGLFQSLEDRTGRQGAAPLARSVLSLVCVHGARSKLVVSEDRIEPRLESVPHYPC